jgi:hypothetical protein
VTKKDLREKVNKAASSGAKPSTKDLDKISRTERERTKKLNARIDASKIKVHGEEALTKRDLFEGLALLAIISKAPEIKDPFSRVGVAAIKKHAETAKAYAHAMAEGDLDE